MTVCISTLAKGGKKIVVVVDQNDYGKHPDEEIVNNDYYKNDFFRNLASEDTGDNIFNKYRLWDSFKRPCSITVEDKDFFANHNQESQGDYFKPTPAG